MRADLLAEPIAGLDEALAAVDAFDQVLVAGLLRPEPAQAAGLARLAQAVAGTPLASRVAEAAEKAAAGVAGEDHLTVLAAARTALLGSVHDALRAQIAEATGRPQGHDDRIAPSGPPATGLRAAARSWLSEVARSGWRGLDSDVVAGSAQVTSAMLPDQALRRLATLLDGFAAELAASCPGSALKRVPVRRWADLWSRAMLLTLTGPARPAGNRAGNRDGDRASPPARHRPAGTPDRGPGAGARGLRARRRRRTAPGPRQRLRAEAGHRHRAGVWQLLRPHMSLLAAYKDGRSMDLAGLPVTAEGDLIWSDDHARPGKPADPFATARVALPAAADPPTAPLDRHPARIAVPVFLEGYAAGDNHGALTCTVAGHPLTIDTTRIPAAGPLTPRAVAASSACIGLLRWDAGSYSVQPLVVATTERKRAIPVHAGGWAGGAADKQGAKAEQAAAEALAVLRERAGRLLRR